MKKLLIVAVLFASGCGVQLSDQAMGLFPQLEKNTVAAEQNFRVQFAPKIEASLKDGPDKAALQAYLKVHAAELAGVAETAKQLNAAVNGGK